MIWLDPNVQSTSPVGKVGNSSKKEKDTKFKAKSKAQSAAHCEASQGIVDLGGMLFLQEVDQFAEDKQNLEEFSKKAFKVLRGLQIDLLEGKVSSKRLHSLRDMIDSSKLAIASAELADLAEQILLRVEVEVAKIEINEKN